MRKFYVLSLILMYGLAVQAQIQKHRLIILADMGNEPDEMQQMAHLLMYSNEFDLEGLLAVTGKYLRPDHGEWYRRVLHPELFLQLIDGYEKVVENLKRHSKGWPEANYLRSIVASGQTGYGIQEAGKGLSSPGSELILKSALKEDARPIYIVVNAGSNTLAQALIDFEIRYPGRDINNIIKKLRVYENGAQDNSGAWICSKYPDIQWIRSNFQTYCYGGPEFERDQSVQAESNLGPYTWEPYEYSSLGQHQWALEHVISKHGHLGMIYPLRQSPDGKIHFIEGGGTIPWLSLIHLGLSDIDQPGWGGWSGRFTGSKVENVWSKHKDVKADELNYGTFALYTEEPDEWTDPNTGITINNVYTPVWRWREAYFEDFKCRMDWCVEDYNNANHHPIAAVNGDLTEKIHFLNVKAGDSIPLDATASIDPDGDKLAYSWWVYMEAGSYDGKTEIKGLDARKCTVEIPENARNESIHVILEITDLNEIGSLKDYRRIVLNVI